MRFLDTNVLLYAISDARDESAKTAVARAVMNEQDLGLSAQVLQEFYVQATRVTRASPLRHQQAVDLIATFCRFPVQSIDVGLVSAAVQARDRYQLSYWDAAIIEAARRLGCSEVLSEDLSHGQDYGGIVVINPFE